MDLGGGKKEREEKIGGRKVERSSARRPKERETKGKGISLSRVPQFRDLLPRGTYEQSDGATDENSEGQFKNVKSSQTRRVAANKIKRTLARK